MRLRFPLVVALAIAGMAACSPSGEPVSPGNRDAGDAEADGGCTRRDEDGDTIADDDEGRAAAIDTDRDTIPDFRDPDSDDDTIPDAQEAGDTDPCTIPRDSDTDGIPDFRDQDSDGNGVFDRFEPPGDLDGDTIPNSRDTDDDGDTIPDAEEIGGNPALPPDTDSDTIPDYRDPDSDGDTISDRDERGVDTDRDGTPDNLDLDSDGDTILDAEEAGDSDLSTYPADDDDDTVPNFRDADSDADGLSDRMEREMGTDPRRADSDGDDVPDLVEVAAGTDPRDPADNPRARGNFVFIVPYEEDPNPEQDTLVFGTDLQKADVYIAIDSSGSMADEIRNVREGVRDIIVPGIRGRITDTQFGIGRFEDCPPTSCANACHNIQDVTADVTLVQNALNSMTTTCGGTEPYRQMLWLLATGDTGAYGTWVRPRPRRCSDPSTVGWPCFRHDAVKIAIQIGDEPFSQSDSCSPNPNHATTVAAMNTALLRYIGITSDAAANRASMEAVARDTGSVDATTGRPFVFTISGDGSGLSGVIVDAVDQIARNVPIRVDAIPEDGADEPPRDPPVDAPREFIAYIEANTSGRSIFDPVTGTDRVCTAGIETADSDGDGHHDYFPRVFPGTSVCWDIHARRNVTVEPLPHVPQLFRARIEVLGDMYTPLDSREIFFLVPPFIPPPGGPE